MKVLISEKQYKTIFIKEQGEPVDPEPKSGASDEQGKGGQGYPDVSTWEDVVGSTLERGPGNQIKNTTWSDIVGSQVTRGAGNQVNEQSITGFNPHTNALQRDRIKWTKEGTDQFQALMDWAGLIPIAGDFLDLANALLYFGRSIYYKEFYPYAVDGMLSLIAIVPVIGSAFSIPTKALIKKIGKKGLSPIIQSISKGKGQFAADLFIKAMKKIPNGEKLLKDFIETIKPLMSKTEDYYMLFLKLDEYISKLPRLIRNNAIIKGAISITKLSGKGIKNFFETIIKFGDEVVGGLLKYNKIPKEMLTNSGRLVGNNIPLFKKVLKKISKVNLVNSEKMFLAIQDMYMNHLVKGGGTDILSDLTIIRQAMDNLGMVLKKGELAGNVARTSPKLQREITNLTIVNHPEHFYDFIKSPTFVTRFQTWSKAITDPSIYKDVTTLWGALKTMGVKGVLAYGKESTQTPEQQKARMEKLKRRQAQIDTLNSKTKGEKLVSTPKVIAAPTMTYKAVTGFPFKVGQSNPLIGNIEKCLKVSPTGNYTKKLKQELIKRGFNVSNGITWDTYKKIRIDCLKNTPGWRKI